MEDTGQSTSPPPSPTLSSALPAEDTNLRPKKTRKKRKSDGDAGDGGGKTKPVKKRKEGKERKKEKSSRSTNKHLAQQMAAQDQMRRALEDDRYSAAGSIVSDTDSDDDNDGFQRSDVRTAMRKRLWMMERRRNSSHVAPEPAAATEDTVEKGEESSGNASRRSSGSSAGRKKKSKKSKSSKGSDTGFSSSDDDAASDGKSAARTDEAQKGAYEDGSIFGPTTGSSHATWVECDKCKKWRRLRGVVDETKLPSRWYCSMNKNDPERARCSAPEEEYSETAKPEEDAADARTRKHLRVWVRRLRCQEAFRHARRPVTRGGNKRSTSSNCKEPYQWIRCSSCGKWRACLRFMDKNQFIDRNSEWYCVMNTWDEKMASCAAPQENLPPTGCPPWVMQDEN